MSKRSNQITVVARQSNQVQAQQTIFVQGKGEAPATARVDPVEPF